MRYTIHCKGVAKDRHEEAETLTEAVEIGGGWMNIDENQNSYLITDTENGETFDDDAVPTEAFIKSRV